jgi:hypothetical protein
MSPDELVEFQRGAVGEDRWLLLDLAQRYVLSLEGRAKYKRRVYASIRSFFLHNRAPLSRDPSFKLRGDYPKVVGRLTVKELRRILDASNRCYRAFFLCAFQGGMGMSEAIWWSNHGVDATLR